MADMAASVLAKLKNKAKSSGISYQQCLQLFFQEEFLRRLAGSKYAENFVLKGGLFIYTLTNFESRATVDVDFLMRGLNNDLARMDEIIALLRIRRFKHRDSGGHGISAVVLFILTARHAGVIGGDDDQRSGSS